MGSSVVLLGDQLPMPSQQGLRSDNAGDLGKNLSSQRLGLYGQSSALMVIEAHSPATELFSKHLILLAEIFNDLQLAVVHPPGDGDQHKPERVEHFLGIQNPLSRPPTRGTEPSHLHADPVSGPYGVYSDRLSGAKEARPGLNALMADARRGAFDVLVVWRFDRFARSVKQLVLALEEFRSLGIDFISHQEALDSSTPMGAGDVHHHRGHDGTGARRNQRTDHRRSRLCSAAWYEIRKAHWSPESSISA